MPDPSKIVRIAPAAATYWFGARGIGFTGPLRFERIGLGQSNLTYLVHDVDDRRWVLPRPPLGQLLASAYDVVREARIMGALEPTDVPVPGILGVAQDPGIANVPLVLMEFIDGQVVDTMAIAESLASQRRRQIGVSLPTTLAEMSRSGHRRVGRKTILRVYRAGPHPAGEAQILAVKLGPLDRPCMSSGPPPTGDCPSPSPTANAKPFRAPKSMSVLTPGTTHSSTIHRSSPR